MQTETLDQRRADQPQKPRRQTLTQQVAPEQRRDNTGDMFGGPTAENVARARQTRTKQQEDDRTAPLFSREPSRSRPRSTITFATPITGPVRRRAHSLHAGGGNPWSLSMRAAKTVLPHFRPGTIQRRTQKRAARLFTQLVVEQNGESKTVSAESAIRALGCGTAARS